MNLKGMRESCGLKQKDLVTAMQKEGLKATKQDLSRIENGIIETYLFLAFRAEEIIKHEITRAKAKDTAQANLGSCNNIPIQAERVKDYISTHGYATYEDLAVLLGTNDKREIRRVMQEARTRYPIVDRMRGFGIAESVAECDKQIRIYEKKKRVYSYQETPLIAKKYELGR